MPLRSNAPWQQVVTFQGTEYAVTPDGIAAIPPRHQEEENMPVTFRRVTGQPYSTYAVMRGGRGIGYVMYDRGTQWMWTPVGLGSWARASTNRRTSAANDILDHYGFDRMPVVVHRRSRTGSSARPRPQGRVFGVELELTGPNSGTIIRALQGAGIRVAAANRYGDATSYRATNGSRHEWELKHDSSVHGAGLELVSPKLRGDAGLEEVRTVCEALRSAGATVDVSCGLHVHHDFRDASLDQIKAQVKMFLDRQDLIWQLVAPSRRDNSYCPAWNETWIQQLERATRREAAGTIGPRGLINMWALGVHGSVEIRAHAGTTNAKKIVAWVRFGQAMFAAGEAGATVSTGLVEQMLLDLMPFGLTEEDAAWLLRFRTAGETRATVARQVAALREQADAAESVMEEVA